jgi:hypothetical protein
MARVKELEDGKLQVTFSNGVQITLRKPNKTTLSAVLAASRKDALAGSECLLKQCQVEGPTGLAENTGYAHSLMKAMPEIFGQHMCLLRWADDEAYLEFSDGKTALLRQPTRSEYSNAINSSKFSPLRYVEDILRQCWIGGDETIKDSPGHLLGLSEVMDDLLAPTGERLGN